MAYCNSVFLLSVPPCFCYCQSLLYSVEYEYSLTEYKFRVNADKNIHQAYILREQILTNTFSPALHIFHISKYFKVFQSIRKQICSASHLFSIPNVFFRSPDKTAPHIPNQMIFYRYCLPFFVHIAQLNFRNFFLKKRILLSFTYIAHAIEPWKRLVCPQPADVHEQGPEKKLPHEWCQWGERLNRFETDINFLPIEGEEEEDSKDEDDDENPRRRAVRRWESLQNIWKSITHHLGGQKTGVN